VTSSDGANWSTQTSNTSGLLDAVVWNGKQLVAVGENGTIVTSDDGIAWSVQTSGTSDDLDDIAWDGMKYIAVGESGTMLTSADGLSWSAVNSGVPNWIDSIVWNGEQYVAVGSGGLVLRSTDGLSWNTETSNTSNWLISVGWNGEQYLAIGINGTIINSNDGINWITQDSEVNTALYGVTWDGAQWITVGDFGTILTSTSSCIAIPAAPSGLVADEGGCALINITWVDNASDEDGFILERSADGISGWVAIASLGANVTSVTDLTGVACQIWFYRVKSFNASGNSGYSNIDSGTTLCVPLAPTTLVATGIGFTQVDVSWVDNADNEDGFVLERSMDGISGWTQIGGNLAANVTTYNDLAVSICQIWFYRVSAFNCAGSSAYSNVDDGAADCTPPVRPYDLVTASLSNSEIDLTWTDNSNNEDSFIIERSDDGIGGWAVIATTAANVTSYSDMTVSGGGELYYRVASKLAAVSSPYSNMFSAVIFEDQPGVNWVEQISGTSQVLHNAVWGGTLYVVVGNNGTILTSPDTVDWTARVSGTTAILYDVVWDESKFVAVGGGGVLLSSADGISWSPVSSGTSDDLHNIIWNGMKFVAVGKNGSIISSNDGSSWVVAVTGVGHWLDGVAWDGSKFVVVGWMGGMLSSPDAINWTAQASGVGDIIQDIGWNGSLFVTDSWLGKVSSSSNGIAWVPENTGVGNWLQGHIWSATQYVTVGDTGRIITSPDASSWTAQFSPTTNKLNAAGWSGTEFIAVGESGRILTSTGTLPNLSGYDQWVIDTVFGGLDATKPGDPDGDGIPNVIEYALDLEPLGTSDVSKLPKMVYNFVLNRVEFSFRRVRFAQHATYIIQSSTDLVNWTDEVTNPGSVGSVITWTKPMPATGMIFLRLKVVIP